MAVRKEDIHNLVERLPEDVQKNVFDFMEYLVNHSTEKQQKKIYQADPDDEPLTEEELFRELINKPLNLVERLPEDDQRNVFDFMQYLLNHPTEKQQKKIYQADPNDEPLTEEELFRELIG